MKRFLAIPALLAMLLSAVPVHAQQTYALTVYASDFQFMPNAIHLKVGQPYDMTFINTSADDHDMKTDMPITDLQYVQADNDSDEQTENVADNEFDVDFNAGDTAEIIFTPTTPGTYTFHCDESGHTELGMVGTFVVD